MTMTNFLYFRYVSNEKKMSFVSFWKNTKNVICLFLEKKNKKKCFWKKSKIGLNSFWKKQKMSFVSFWNKMWPQTMFKTHFASVHGRVRTVSKGECCRCTMLDSTTVGHPPRPPPWHQIAIITFTVLRNPVLHNRRCQRLLPRSKGVIMSLSIGTQR